ncbi:hypothetical protein QZH41_019034 [Actinostola sp. cb2023]|nr:hypothetical protein QZH41_019034 [Actinostola sp. cb2023]
MYFFLVEISNMLTSLVAIILLPWIRASAQTCESPYSQNDFKIKGHVIKTLTSTRKQCEEHCASQQDCHSINFYQSKRTCELNSANHMSNPESLLPSSDCQYMDFPKRPPAKCNYKFCSEPLACVKDDESYKCVPCEEAGGKEVLQFPRKSVSDYVFVENAFTVSLSAFTVAMWVQLNTSITTHTPFTYSSPSENDEIGFYLTKDYVEFTIDDTLNRNTPPISDNKWHHLCLTWENTAGSYKMYIDGVVTVQGNGIRTGYVIPKGTFMLGQEQDSYKGGFELHQSFQGNLSSANMWDKVLTPQEVLALAKSCPTREGNIIKWSTLKDKNNARGSVTPICSSFCV